MFQPQTDRVIIISPFLAKNINQLLSEFSFNATQLIELITTFKPSDPEQLTKPKILKDFFEHFRNNHSNVKVKIHIDNQLHGKIYVAMNGATLHEIAEVLGHKTLEMAKDAHKIIIGSFLNLQAVCNYCINYQGDILIICAGREGKYSLEDTACAGMMIHSLRDVFPGVQQGVDANFTAQLLYEKFGHNILEM